MCEIHSKIYGVLLTFPSTKYTQIAPHIAYMSERILLRASRIKLFISMLYAIVKGEDVQLHLIMLYEYADSEMPVGKRYLQ